MGLTANFLVHCAFSLMALCAILLLPNCSKNRSVSLFILLMLCGCGYLITETFGPLSRMSIIWWLEYIASNALPGVFWLVSLSIFAEKHQIKRWQYMTASMTLLIPLVSLLLQLALRTDLTSLPVLWRITTYGAMSLELALLIHALTLAVKNWQADLVQTRRYMRGSVIGMIALYLVVVITVEQVLSLQWHWLTTAKYAFLSLLVLGVNFLLFGLKDGSLFTQAEIKPASLPAEKQYSPELQRILDSMDNQKLYQKEGMTISALSRHLSIHEYKLRKLINGELAYRNFNDFLNFYRIQEVAGKLSNPENHHLPVLTLALDSGFRSLSSFNKAFKNTHGMTPTEYRNKT